MTAQTNVEVLCAGPSPGVCDANFLGLDGPGIVISDIPGLLEGAHRGLGLGRAFLRHIERCRLILHVVDGSSPDPLRNFRAINQELELFNPRLAEKPQVRGLSGGVGFPRLRRVRL